MKGNARAFVGGAKSVGAEARRAAHEGAMRTMAGGGEQATAETFPSTAPAFPSMRLSTLVFSELAARFYGHQRARGKHRPGVFSARRCGLQMISRAGLPSPTGRTNDPAFSSIQLDGSRAGG